MPNSQNVVGKKRAMSVAMSWAPHNPPILTEACVMSAGAYSVVEVSLAEHAMMYTSIPNTCKLRETTSAPKEV